VIICIDKIFHAENMDCKYLPILNTNLPLWLWKMLTDSIYANLMFSCE